jgi:translation initiation factor 5A
MSDGDAQGEIGAHCVPKQASAIRKGGHAMLKDHPCKIADLSTSKTGKHGHAKVKMTGICVLTDKKYQELYSSTHNVSEPIVTKLELQVTDIVDGVITCMDDDCNEILVRVPEDEGTLGAEIVAGHAAAVKKDMDIVITLLKAPVGGDLKERVVGWKETIND